MRLATEGRQKEQKHLICSMVFIAVTQPEIECRHLTGVFIYDQKLAGLPVICAFIGKCQIIVCISL